MGALLRRWLGVKRELKWLAPRQGEVGLDFCEVGGGDYKEIAGSRCALAWCMRFFAGLDGLIYAVFRG